jgi:hypothetical protein
MCTERLAGGLGGHHLPLLLGFAVGAIALGVVAGVLVVLGTDLVGIPAH